MSKTKRKTGTVCFQVEGAFVVNIARVSFCGNDSDDHAFKYTRFHMDEVVRSGNINSENELLEFADRAATFHEVNRVIYTLLRHREELENELLRLSGDSHE
ncbi:hypothetical protein ACSG7X_000487 [Vibrio fluvialis]